EGAFLGISPNITAHAGCEGTAPGSLSSVYDGIRLRADFVEVDVRRTRSGELVLSHDKPSEEDSCVRLFQVLELVKGFRAVGVNCDIKEEDILRDVLDLAERTGLRYEQIVISGSVTPAALKSDPSIVKRANVLLNIEEALKALCMSRLQSDAPDIAALPPWEAVRRYIPDPSDYFDDLVDTCLSCHVRAVNVPYRPPISGFLPRFRAAGLPVSVWTVDDPEEIKAVLREGVYNITTRRVRLALEARKNHPG
ncbi:MAG TPA: glycerophosphodiester phosphodiesterase, partial [Feifaniaceae bacterium]|nr:glycerophosphodiester phosphodiesterase [Feifaniaceae bacterium]